MGKSKCANNCTDCFCDVEKYIDETKVDKVALVESIKAKGVNKHSLLASINQKLENKIVLK